MLNNDRYVISMTPTDAVNMKEARPLNQGHFVNAADMECQRGQNPIIMDLHN